MLLSSNKISAFLLFVFTFIVSIDPTGTLLGLKEIFFILLLIVALLKINKNVKIPKDCLAVIWLCLLFPIYGLIVSQIHGNCTNIEYAFGQIKSFLFIFIFFFLIHIDYDVILKILFICGTIIAVCTMVIYIIGQINPDFFMTLYSQKSENSNIILSMREYYGISFLGVYFKTGPFMLFSYVYALYFYGSKRFRKIFILLNLSALLVAGSRTPMLMGALITVIYWYDNLYSKKNIKYLILVIGVLAISVVLYKLATEQGEISNDIKYADFNSYIKEISSGTTFIIGDGLGSEFYSDGRNRMVPATEQTYMDIFRIYGFFIGLILIIAVYYPILFYIKSRYFSLLKYRRFAMAYVLYMVLAGTNPLLISSTGMLIWAIGLTFIYKIRNNQLLKDSFS